MKLETAKGVKDVLPIEKIQRQEIVDTLKRVFELYGYNPFDTPIIERYDTLTAKFTAGAGSDAEKEIFKLKDQGGRKLGLRYDLTVPFSRFIGMNPQMKMPFKRYQIGRVYRDGPIKLGRYREFWQCDVDVVGVKSMLADAEVLSLADNALRELKLKARIEVNNRKLLNGILEQVGVAKDKESAIIAIDKLAKYGKKVVADELKEKGVDKKAIDKVMDLISITGKNDEILSKVKKKVDNDIGKEGIEELEELFSYLKKLGVKSELNLSLARGLGYYTGTVFEVFLKDSNVKSSIAAGGRFDEMIGDFLGGNRAYPAVGISFGLDVISDALNLKEKGANTITQAYLIPIKNTDKCLKILQTLRKEGVRADIDLIGRGISKNLDYANTIGVPYVIIAGNQELKAKKVKLKDMKSGKEKLLSLEKAIKIIKL